jgi:hypothetical protein
MRKRVSKRQAGAKLNQEGRVSPLEALQQRMEYHLKIVNDEIGKGELGSHEVIQKHLAIVQDAAVELAPYRHPRLQSTTTDLTVQSAVKVIASPELCDTNEEWIQKYVPKDLRAKSPTEIDGEVVASATAASPSPAPQPPSTSVELYDPNKFRLEVIQNRYFSLRRIDDPRP